MLFVRSSKLRVACLDFSAVRRFENAHDPWSQIVDLLGHDAHMPTHIEGTPSLLVGTDVHGDAVNGGHRKAVRHALDVRDRAAVFVVTAFDRVPVDHGTVRVDMLVGMWGAGEDRCGEERTYTQWCNSAQSNEHGSATPEAIVGCARNETAGGSPTPSLADESNCTIAVWPLRSVAALAYPCLLPALLLPFP